MAATVVLLVTCRKGPWCEQWVPSLQSQHSANDVKWTNAQIWSTPCTADAGNGSLLNALQNGPHGQFLAIVTAVHTRSVLHHTMPCHAAHLLLSL